MAPSPIATALRPMGARSTCATTRPTAANAAIRAVVRNARRVSVRRRLRRRASPPDLGRLARAGAADAGHVLAILRHRDAAAPSGFAGLGAGEFVGCSALVGRSTAALRELPLLLGAHGGKAARAHLE